MDQQLDAAMVITYPLPLVLHCPMCRTQHVDRDIWETQLHRTHLCASCGHEWRPANVYTVGVLNLPEPKQATPATDWLARVRLVRHRVPGEQPQGSPLAKAWDACGLLVRMASDLPLRPDQLMVELHRYQLQRREPLSSAAHFMDMLTVAVLSGYLRTIQEDGFWGR